MVSLLYLLAIPIFLYLSFKKKYKHSIPARFFLKNSPSFKKHDIWFHACSLGEVSSLETVIANLDGYDIDISVITQTGFKRAKEIKNSEIRYLPFEIFLPFWIRKHRVLVVTEAELWPMLFFIAKKKGTKTILINARISDNSYGNYMKFIWFYRWVFSNIDIVFAQSKKDRDRLEKLGARDVRIGGNIKADTQPVVTKKYNKPNRRVIIIASSHEGEEKRVLRSIAVSKKDLIIVVPRHPERFKKVEKFLIEFCKEKSMDFSKITHSDDLDKDIVLCDKMGELVNLYAVSDIVILCGSFVDGIGGHNPLEPAFFGRKIVSGPYIFNQKVLFSLVENIKICKIDELQNVELNNLKQSKIKKSKQIEDLLKEIRVK